MTNYIIRLLILAVVVKVSSGILEGISVDTYTTAILVALVMSLLNTFVKPILQVLSIPITILTLGLFYFVINVGIVYLCAYFVDGFSVAGFIAPLIFGFILSIINSLVSWFQE